MKKWLGLVALALCAMLLPVWTPAADAADDRALTLMIYITGSDLESTYGAASKDIQEMMEAGLSRDVTVLVMTGGTGRWDLAFDPAQTAVTELTPRGMRVVERYDAMNMGDPDTLLTLLDLGAERYPAGRYALILWDHGGGPMNGVCFDELQGGDCLTMPELRAALEASPFSEENPLEWIGFDACLMAGAETAKICAPFARYMIASQETEPGCGWNYAFLDGIARDVDGAATGGRIIESYFDAAPGDAMLTLSCLDLARVGDVESAVDGLFAALAGEVTPEGFPALSNHRRDARGFGRGSTGSDYDLVDLCDLARQYADLAPQAVEALEDAISNAVVHFQTNIENANGLSAYYPYYNKDNYIGLWRDRYAELGFAPDYCAYMRGYTDLWLGEPLTDFSEIVAEAEASGAAQLVTLQLTDEQAAHYASAELYILAQAPEVTNAYMQVFSTQDVDLDADGRLGFLYDYEALYALDESGVPLTEAFQYVQVEDTFFLEGYLLPRDPDEGVGIPAALMFRRAEGSDELEYRGMILLGDRKLAEYLADADAPAPRQDSALDTDRWAGFYVMHLPQYPTYSPRGKMMPFWAWRLLPLAYFDTSYIDFSGPWRLAFCHRQYSGVQLFAQYVVTDTQGNMFASPLLPIDNPNGETLGAVNATLVDDGGVRLDVGDIEAVNARYRGGLYLHLTVRNDNDRDLVLLGSRLTMNGTTVGRFSLRMAIASGSEAEAAIYVAESDLPPLEGLTLRSLGLALDAGDGENARALSGQVACDVDMSALDIPDTASLDVLAEARDGDAVWQLVGLSREDGAVSARFRVVNRGAEEYRANSSDIVDFAVNGCLFHGDVTMNDCAIPAGGTQYVNMTLGATSSALYSGTGSRPAQAADASIELSTRVQARRFVPENALERWNIGDIASLRLMLYGSYDRIMAFAPGGDAPDGGEPEGAPLLEAGDVRAWLRGVRASGGSLWLDLDVENLGDAPVVVNIERASIDGAGYLPVDAAAIEFEGGNVWSGDGANGLYPHTKQRALARLDTAGDSLSSIELCFGVGGQVTRPARIAFPSALAWPAAEGPIADLPEVTPATPEADATVDPAALLDPAISLPEDPGQYRMTLSTRLTEAQAAAMDSARAVLVKRDGDSLDIIASITGGAVGDDNVLRVDFSGLVLCVEGLEQPPVQLIDGENVYPLLAYLDRADDRVGLDIGLRFDGETAAFDHVTASRELRASESFDTMIFAAMNLLPTEDGDGGYLHYNYWPATDVYYYGRHSLRSGAPRFVFRPARELGLYVIFGVKDADGGSYTILSMDPVG